MEAQWTSENHIWATKRYISDKFKTQAKFTQHFFIRLFQRYDSEERRDILVEISYLLKSGMYPKMFSKGQKEIVAAINNTSSIACTYEKGRIVIKTIYKGTHSVM